LNGSLKMSQKPRKPPSEPPASAPASLTGPPDDELAFPLEDEEEDDEEDDEVVSPEDEEEEVVSPEEEDVAPLDAPPEDVAPPLVAPELDEADAPLPVNNPLPDEPPQAHKPAIPSAKPRERALFMRPPRLLPRAAPSRNPQGPASPRMQISPSQRPDAGHGAVAFGGQNRVTQCVPLKSAAQN
jgi:hypothetical protein